MNYGKAVYIAESFKDAIAPYCERVEIAGSVRRKRAECGDIEIVCITKMENYEVSDGLFTKIETGRNREFIKILNSMNILEGNAKTGKYIKRYSGKAEIKFDIFCTVKENWGNIFAIRIGSADFSHHILAEGWRAAGYKSHEGFLYKCNQYEEINGKLVLKKEAEPTFLYEEQELFNLIKINEEAVRKKYLKWAKKPNPELLQEVFEFMRKDRFVPYEKRNL